MSKVFRKFEHVLFMCASLIRSGICKVKLPLVWIITQLSLLSSLCLWETNFLISYQNKDSNKASLLQLCSLITLASNIRNQMQSINSKNWILKLTFEHRKRIFWIFEILTLKTNQIPMFKTRFKIECSKIKFLVGVLLTVFGTVSSFWSIS